MMLLGVRRSIALGLLLGCGSACDLHEDPDQSGGDETGETGEIGETGDELAQGISPVTLRWTLDWDPIDDRARVGERGRTSFEIVNDLGYRVRVDAGWIGTWGMTLVECSVASAGDSLADPESPSEELGVASPWLVGEGHSSGQDDPSAWVFAGVESLTERLVVKSEALALTGARYCQAHSLLAPISDASDGFAEAEAALALIEPELSLAGASVVILGTWEPPGGGEATPFVLRSEQAYGKILELDYAESLGDLDDAATELVVRRELGSMFDGIDFAGAELDAASWQLLGNLAKQTHAEARTAE